MSIRIKLGRLELVHPLMNAAGTCTDDEEVFRFINSAVSAVVVGSITKEPLQIAGQYYCTQNSGRVALMDGSSLNVCGSLNCGWETVKSNLSAWRRAANEIGKPLIVSFSASSPRVFEELVGEAFQLGVDAVEINFGNPLLETLGKYKRLMSFDIDAVYETLSRIHLDNPVRSVGVKFSPFSDPSWLVRMARIVAESSRVGFVTTTNSFPNALAYDPDGKPLLKVGDGLGALGGKALKPIGLGQVFQWRRALDEIGRTDIDVVGVGGISHAPDIRDYLRAGAKAVQVGTEVFASGLGVIREMLDEYQKG